MTWLPSNTSKTRFAILHRWFLDDSNCSLGMEVRYLGKLRTKICHKSNEGENVTKDCTITHDHRRVERIASERTGVRFGTSTTPLQALLIWKTVGFDLQSFLSQSQGHYSKRRAPLLGHRRADHRQAIRPGNLEYWNRTLVPTEQFDKRPSSSISELLIAWHGSKASKKKYFWGP